MGGGNGEGQRTESRDRRPHRAIDLLHDIEGLKRRGYDEPEIARKTSLTIEYVKAVIGLLEHGEHRLLRAVESGHVPVSVAVEIAEADDAEVQNVLQQAYEKKTIAWPQANDRQAAYRAKTPSG